jgi:hypothetical protein
MSAELDRLEELLAQRATEGLDEAASAELNRLLERHPDVDAEQHERAAAAIHVANLGRLEPLPEHVRRSVLAAASAVRAPVAVVRPAKPASAWPWLAVAAALLIAAIGWWPRLVGPTAPVEERAALVAAGAREIAWTATADAAAVGASGDVVWDAVSQTGFMRFVGLAPNEPTRLQYQLWIFDRLRDERYPVDGGVFDI